MASRLKEDEKNEKIIRGLLKLPANKRCINCNSLGPQYVCTNFWTFICTNCSGIHREFTHRVKSVSMAKFTSQEVNALQEGGNERAKELLFKDWDPQRHSFPDSSNVDKLRTFIKHVYVDRRYSGERSADRPPRVKGDREDYEQRRQDASLGGSRSPASHSGSQSPQYDETYGRRYGGSPVLIGRNDDRSIRQNYGGKSPVRELGQADYRRSPGRLEADNRHRDDRYASANQNKKIEDSRPADGRHKTQSSSPNLQNQKDVKISPPIIRPVRDILGDDAPALVVGEPPKSNIAPATQVPTLQTSTATENISGSNTKQTEPKKVYLSSLIDFGIDDEPASARKSEETVTQETAPTSEENWAFFDSVTEKKEQNPETKLNSLDDTLNLLNVPGVTPVASDATIGTSSPSKSAAPHHASQHSEPSLFSAAATASKSTVSSFMPPAVETSNNQGWPTSVPSNTLETLTTTTGFTQASEVPYVEQTAESPQQLEKMEAKSTGRKELPADLFAALYPTTQAPAMGWQTNPNNFAAGYGMQYHMPMVFPQFSYTPQPAANPFDVQPRLPHSSTFPSMESLQGALPSAINSSGLIRSSSFGANPLPQWMPQQQPDGYMGQQILSSMPYQNSTNASQMGHRGFDQAANQQPALGPPSLDQQLHSTYSQPSPTNSFFTTGGNPFG